MRAHVRMHAWVWVWLCACSARARARVCVCACVVHLHVCKRTSVCTCLHALHPTDVLHELVRLDESREDREVEEPLQSSSHIGAPRANCRALVRGLAVDSTGTTASGKSSGAVTWWDSRQTVPFGAVRDRPWQRSARPPNGIVCLFVCLCAGGADRPTWYEKTLPYDPPAKYEVVSGRRCACTACEYSEYPM